MNKLNFLNTNEFLIPSTTGEYLPTNITRVYETFELEDSNPELFDELMDNGITIIYAVNIKEAHQAFDELLKQLLDILHSNHIGDDDFYDYLPDLVNQMQHIGLLFNFNLKEDNQRELIPWRYIQQIVKNFDYRRGEDDTDTLEENCEFPDDACTQLINEQYTIKEILDKYPDLQQ